jgi:hypothetical protein
MRQILEKYPKIQSTELLMSAGNLIQQVKSFNYEERTDPTLFIESVDQLTLAFSTRFENFLKKKLLLYYFPICLNTSSISSLCYQTME